MKRGTIYAILFTGSDTAPAKLVSGSDCQVSAYTDRCRADELCADLIKHRGPRFCVVPYASAGDRLPAGDLLLMAESAATTILRCDWGRRAIVDFLLSKLREVAESAAAIGAARERSAVAEWLRRQGDESHTFAHRLLMGRIARQVETGVAIEPTAACGQGGGE